MRKDNNRRIIVLLLSIVMLTCLAGCKSRNATDEINSLDDIHGLRYGILTGSLDEVIHKERFSDCEPYYFNSSPDMIAALKENKIDCMDYEGAGMSTLLAETDGIKFIDESVYEEQFAFAFAKDTPRAKKLCSEFSEFIQSMKDTGELEALEKDWTENYDTLVVDDSGMTGENGKVTLAIPFDTAPFNFIREGEGTGFEYDLFIRFCKQYGYEPVVNTMSFSGLIPAVTTGKADMIADYICVTDERKESVAFSTPYAVGQIYMVVRGEPERTSFFSGIARGFKKTFIDEHRWKMVLSGIGTTLAISIASILIGSIIGFLIYLLCRRGNKLLIKIFNGLSWVVSTLPTVVLLMLLFYVVFGKTSMSGFVVSIIAFSIFMALGVYSAMSVAVKSIDRGQFEGAYALGYSDMKSFMRIILPQAMEQFIPNYKGLLVSLVQGTSIVGYIAVEDLTRVSDIIRGRTYEAFFPIVSTAIIYLILCWMLTVIIKRIEIKHYSNSATKEEVMRRFGK